VTREEADSGGGQPRPKQSKLGAIAKTALSRHLAGQTVGDRTPVGLSARRPHDGGPAAGLRALVCPTDFGEGHVG
jgi:hypothetical protein